MTTKDIHIHILNGDALLQQFPKEIKGEKIIMRECLVDGDVGGDNLPEFYSKRASFLEANYRSTKGDYERKSISELNKITNISQETSVNLWFEDDLFCQVNLWFVAHLLKGSNNSNEVFLVRPTNSSLQYGFGGLDENALLTTFTNRAKLMPAEVTALSDLWGAYKSDSRDRMQNIAFNNRATLPFLPEAVEAHLDRFSKNGLPGRPEKSLLKIMEDLGLKDFGPVFKEFSRREPIYGFGDLQVKRLFNNLIADLN